MNRVEREVVRRRRRRIADLNRNDHQIFTMMLRITLFAVGFIICAAIFFWSASKAAEEVQAAVLRSHRITDGPLYGPQITMVEPLPEFPPEDGEPPQAIEIKMASKADAVPEETISKMETVAEPEERWESLGKWKISHYCACRRCSGKWGHRTSSGATCEEGVTAACAILPAGTVVRIEGYGERIIQDTGAGVRGQHLDLFYESHQECLDRGIKYREVWVKR